MIKRCVRVILWVFLLNVTLTSFGLADTVYLKGGHIAKGEIIEETVDYIVLSDSQTAWNKVFYKKLISRIDSDKRIDLQSYEKAGREVKTVPDYAFADTVYLKGGHTEKGDIVEDTAEYIVLLDPRNLWRKVFYKKLIEKIESAKSIDLDSYTKLPVEIKTEVSEVKAGPDYAFADTVYLKDGHIENGEIIEDSTYYIVLLDAKSRWQKIFYKTMIERIDSTKNIDMTTYKQYAADSEAAGAGIDTAQDSLGVQGEGEGAAAGRPSVDRIRKDLFPFFL